MAAAPELTYGQWVTTACGAAPHRLASSPRRATQKELKACPKESSNV